MLQGSSRDDNFSVINVFNWTVLHLQQTGFSYFNHKIVGEFGQFPVCQNLSAIGSKIILFAFVLSFIQTLLEATVKHTKQCCLYFIYKANSAGMAVLC